MLARVWPRKGKKIKCSILPDGQVCKTQLHKHEPLFRKWPPPSGLVPGLASQCYTGLGEEWTPEASLGQSDSQILSKKNLEWKARDVSISISA